MNTLQEYQIESPRKSKKLRVAFIGTTVSGVMKYRMGSFAWQMRKFPNVETVLWPYAHSITVQNPWQVDMISRSDIMRMVDNLCDKADVVVWQALDFPHSFELWQGMKMRHQKPFLMEIDDYVSDVPLGNEAYEQYRAGAKRHQVAMEQLRTSDGVIVSTPYLAEQYKGMNDRIYVVPNSIDFNEWKGLGIKKHDRIRIGWIGGGGHAKDLEMIAPAMKEVLAKHQDAWFYCIHGCPNIYKKWDKVFYTTKFATINLYPKFMASYKFDIGIAPLEDNNFNRGKSNLRWLEYSALKLPTIASALPDFKRVINHGENGYLADSHEAWVEYLSLLIEDEQKRRDIGKAAYESVKANFNVNKTANHYRHILQEFI